MDKMKVSIGSSNNHTQEQPPVSEEENVENRMDISLVVAPTPTRIEESSNMPESIAQHQAEGLQQDSREQAQAQQQQQQAQDQQQNQKQDGRPDQVQPEQQERKPWVNLKPWGEEDTRKLISEVEGILKKQKLEMETSTKKSLREIFEDIASNYPGRSSAECLLQYRKNGNIAAPEVESNIWSEEETKSLISTISDLHEKDTDKPLIDICRMTAPKFPKRSVLACFQHYRQHGDCSWSQAEKLRLVNLVLEETQQKPEIPEEEPDEEDDEPDVQVHHRTPTGQFTKKAKKPEWTDADKEKLTELVQARLGQNENETLSDALNEVANLFPDFSIAEMKKVYERATRPVAIPKGKWTKTESELLEKLVDEQGVGSGVSLKQIMVSISDRFPNRTIPALLKHYYERSKSHHTTESRASTKWTSEETAKLMQMVEEHMPEGGTLKRVLQEIQHHFPKRSVAALKHQVDKNRKGSSKDLVYRNKWGDDEIDQLIRMVDEKLNDGCVLKRAIEEVSISFPRRSLSALKTQYEKHLKKIGKIQVVPGNKWTQEENEKLLRLIAERRNGITSLRQIYEDIVDQFPNRSVTALKGQHKRCKSEKTLPPLSNSQKHVLVNFIDEKVSEDADMSERSRVWDELKKMFPGSTFESLSYHYEKCRGRPIGHQKWPEEETTKLVDLVQQSLAGGLTNLKDVYRNIVAHFPTRSIAALKRQFERYQRKRKREEMLAPVAGAISNRKKWTEEENCKLIKMVDEKKEAGWDKMSQIFNSLLTEFPGRSVSAMKEQYRIRGRKTKFADAASPVGPSHPLPPPSAAGNENENVNSIVVSSVDGSKSNEEDVEMMPVAVESKECQVVPPNQSLQ